MTEMVSPRKSRRSVLERLSWGSSKDPCRDEIVVTENGLAGVIFMCNKATEKQCFLHGVFGLPEARQELVEQVVPGMKLFLFEYESRTLSGVFEATSHGGKNLEPHAYPGQESAFPAQVYFREVMKCPPLLEGKFKAAIHQNYFNSVKFNLDLSLDQVKNLIQLFQNMKSPEKVVRRVDGKSRSHVNGRIECQTKDSKYVPEGYVEKNGNSIHDKIISSDKRPRATSTPQKRSLYAYEEGKVDAGEVSSLKERDLINDLIRSSIQSQNIPSEIPPPMPSGWTITGQATPSHHFSFTHSPRLYERPSLELDSENHLFVGQRCGGNRLLSADEFRDGPDRERGISTGYDPVASSTMLSSVTVGHPHEFRVESLAPSIPDPSLSYVQRSFYQPNETRSKDLLCMPQNVMDSSFLKASLEGTIVNEEFLDIRDEMHLKRGPFDLDNLYARVGGIPHSGSSQHERLLSLAYNHANANEGHAFPYLLHDSAGFASQDRIPEDQVPPVMPLLDGHQVADFLAGQRVQSINNEDNTQRVQPWNIQLCEAPTGSERRLPAVTQSFSYMDNIGHSIRQNEYSHVLSRDLDPAISRFNLEAGENVGVGQHPERTSSSLCRGSFPVFGDSSLQFSGHEISERVFDLQHKPQLLHQLETLDPSRGGSARLDLKIGTYSKTVAPKAVKTGVPSTDDDHQLHKMECTNDDPKAKQSVWSRLSGLKPPEVDRYPVKERIGSREAFSLHPSKFRRLDSIDSAHPHSEQEVFSDQDGAPDEECGGHSQDAFVINFKRRKERTVKQTEQDSSSKTAALQKDFQPVEDRDKSDVTVANANVCIPKRRKLIRPAIFDPSQNKG